MLFTFVMLMWNGKNFITPEGYLLIECYVM